MSELINFRDFGGYPTTDGRRVKKDIFFRCGSYRDLTEEDRHYIKSLNIQNLCDYRERHEIDKDERQSELSKRVHTISASEHLGAFEEDPQAPYTVLSTEGMIEFYERLVFDNPAYINVFELLQNENAVPYLHNCTAGKDRTGIASALILLALGVDEEIVMYDYLKSLEAFDAILENEVRRLKPNRTTESLYHKMPGIIVKPSYLLAAFETIKEKYGDFATYFEKEFSLDEQGLESLRLRFTE
ncbi:tyrosine-protein phosphatase [Erysipelothrix sp. HDW6C]|uniref:tyrosine-protein phosphatase n=1 Tax=Erysipelothrix sp. HDW6C TaxID=2714930 RepID=UPI00140E6252|nr:tyrosine-protein phosphatase [Erysipelothrix sp. HDW6C]QIK69331.1 tyrosine-protein phosphatase [Erysipelothrix sp. HDW6C]